MAEDWTERGAVARMNLNTVLGWADILADPAIDLTAENRREYAEHIATAGVALRSSIDDFLDCLTKAD